ncbi:MAG: hypothetical protein GAK30_01498 [Paracidovorax wautersii]|uniref:Myosin X N-terminal SH3 domain-containing protein n=1 Tax=Paracidovorax wautersii TaxID=1177982 RepID=A0A7V8JQQ0_9BURK|nr:MAG: hypothetical protein GAK30_01498 [Paracidovorax wautersii]
MRLSLARHVHFFVSALRRLAAILAASLALGATASAWADTVWLFNGDRLTGTIQSIDSGVLVMRTDYGGDIRVQTSHIRTLESISELVVLESGPGRQYRARLLPSNDGATAAARTDEAEPAPPETVTLDALERVSRPHDRLLDTAIKGRVDLSANHTSASSTTQSISAALSLEGRHSQWRHQLDAQYAHSKDDDNTSTSNYAGDYVLDRFLGEQAFWQGRASHKRDFVEELDRQTAYGTGPGYQFWDDELGAFSLSGLVGRVHYGYSDGHSEAFYAASLRWNYNRYLRGRQFELYSKGEVSRPLDDSADYAFSGEAGVRYNVTDWMSLYIKYQRDFIGGTRQDLNETRYGTGVGVLW